MLLPSCQTAKTERIEYVEKAYIPDIAFPKFPALTDYERKDGKVIVSEEWIIQLSEYKIRIEETEKTFADIKMLYEKSPISN